MAGPRFEARKDAVHPYYSVFDTVVGSWHLGDYADATYAAGVPAWKSQPRAAEVAATLNATSSVFVVEQFVEEVTTEVVGVRYTLDAAKALGSQVVGEVDQWGYPRGYDIEWREGTDSTQHDPTTALRDWSAHRPSTLPKARTTYLFVHITEHLVPQETP